MIRPPHTDATVALPAAPRVPDVTAIEIHGLVIAGIQPRERAKTETSEAATVPPRGDAR